MENAPSSKFQFYKAPLKTVHSNRTMTIKEAYQYITSLEPMERTHILRSIKNKKEARKFKETDFDFACFGGTFSYRAAEKLIEHSGLMCLDYDHVGNRWQLWSLREKLLQDPILKTELLFTSPSGDGLKQVVEIDFTLGSYQQWFKMLRNYILKTYQVEIDKSCSDVCRACLLPHDASCYVNPIILNEPDVCPF